MSIRLLGLYTEFMKRIIFLIVTFMSFFADAKAEILWEDRVAENINIRAVCIFKYNATKGTVYLLTYSTDNSINPTLEPYIDFQGKEILVCYES